jgi:hypothetical protein
MKCIREGLEDYEYFWMLKRAVAEARTGKGKRPAEWLKRAEAALVVDPALVRSLRSYSTDGSKLLSARRAIGQVLAEKGAHSSQGRE